MKKITKTLLAFLFIGFISLSANAQDLEGLLDSALSMQQKGDNDGLANAWGSWLGARTSGSYKTIPRR